MRLEYLGEHVELIPTVAEWLHAQWDELLPGETIESRIERLQGRANLDRIPMTLVALSGAVPIGTAALVQHDLPGREDLTPWLATVLVPPELRGQGIGSALVQRCVDLAAGYGHESLYLFTYDQQPFFRHLGWEDEAQEDFRGLTVTVMRLGLETGE